jgi:hypothetical protein
MALKMKLMRGLAGLIGGGLAGYGYHLLMRAGNSG